MSRLRSEASPTSLMSTPWTRIRPEVGSASRTRSLASVDLPEPVAPTMATRDPGSATADTSRSTGTPGRYSNETASSTTLGGASGSSTPDTGSSTSIGVSSRSSTLRQPATAVWVMSRISVNSATGSRKSVTRKRNAMSTPAVSPDSGPMITPATITADTVMAAKASPDGNSTADSTPALMNERFCSWMASSVLAIVRCSTPKPRMTAAPMTASDTAESISPTRVLTSSQAASIRFCRLRRMRARGMTAAIAISASRQL